MRADYEFDFSDNSNSRSGCEKKVFIKLPKQNGEGYAVLELGTLNRLAFNMQSSALNRLAFNMQSSVKLVYSIGRKSANQKAHTPANCFGVLAFHVIQESTIEYLKKQIAEVTGEKYIGAFKLHDLPEFDIILISSAEDDTSGNYSKRIIRGVTVDSESGAIGSDVISMTEEYTFKARKIGELTAEEVQIYSSVI